MSISLRERVRRHMLVWRIRTVTQVTAALGKHVTATQAIRAYARGCRTGELVKDPLASGRRRAIRDALNGLRRSGIIAKTDRNEYTVIPK